MARMIPPAVSLAGKSRAEEKIFRWFRDDPITRDWIVLHSVGMSHHNTLPYGEVDFVVLMPFGGVFVLEVKGGRVWRENGLWHFMDRNDKIGTRVRSPFDQVQEGAASLMENLACRSNDPAIHRCLYGHGVMFPDIQFEAGDLNAEPWEVFDSRNGDKVGAYVLSLARHTYATWNRLYGTPDGKIPDKQCVEKIAGILRGDFDFIIPLSKHINDTEQQIIHMTHGQMYCLDQMEDNARCLTHGGAGTGKTLMALEQLRRSVLNGEQVALFCYNVCLGKWLRESARRIGVNPDRYYVGTFHSWMAQYVDMRNEKADDYFYSDVMPERVYEALKQQPSVYDRIIIDEAQDLLRPQYLKLVNACLRNGLSRGCWNMFGDFNRQAIYVEGMSRNSAVELLESHAGFAICRLSINCRNTRNIINEIACIVSMEPMECLHADIFGLPVSYQSYSSQNEQADLLLKLLENIRAQGIAESGVTILSPHRWEKSAASMLINKTIHPVVPGSNIGGITFNTIQAFKGLENAVIILIDMDNYTNSQLSYIGFSRARSMLYVLESKSAFEERKVLLRRTLL